MFSSKKSQNSAAALTVAASLAGATLPAAEADGALISYNHPDSEYVELGQQYLGKTLRYEGVFNGIEIGGSAVRLSENFAITNAHVLTGPNGSVAPEDMNLTDGPNYLTDPGNSYSVSQVIVFPGYDDPNGNNFSRQLPDLAILVGNFGPGESATLAGAAEGSGVVHTGFGFSGLPGQVTEDGNIRGWLGEVELTGDIGSNPEYYNSTFYSAFSTSMELSGKGIGGDSGGGIYDLNGNLVGLNTARIGSDSDGFGSTYYVDLGHPEVQDFIHTNTNLVPEPSTLSWLVGGAALALRRRRRD